MVGSLFWVAVAHTLALNPEQGTGIRWHQFEKTPTNTTNVFCISLAYNVELTAGEAGPRARCLRLACVTRRVLNS